MSEIDNRPKAKVLRVRRHEFEYLQKKFEWTESRMSRLECELTDARREAKLGNQIAFYFSELKKAFRLRFKKIKEKVNPFDAKFIARQKRHLFSMRIENVKYSPYLTRPSECRVIFVIEPNWLGKIFKQKEFKQGYSGSPEEWLRVPNFIKEGPIAARTVRWLNAIYKHQQADSNTILERQGAFICPSNNFFSR